MQKTWSSIPCRAHVHSFSSMALQVLAWLCIAGFLQVIANAFSKWLTLASVRHCVVVEAFGSTRG